MKILFKTSLLILSICVLMGCSPNQGITTSGGTGQQTLLLEENNEQKAEEDKSLYEKRVAIEELEGLKGIHPEWTIEQIEANALYDSKEISEENVRVTYWIDGIEYEFKTLSEKLEEHQRGELNSITVSTNADMERIETSRNIKIGDSFEDTLAKFPQEQDWKTGENGTFYGDDKPTYSYYDNDERGAVFFDNEGDVDGIHIGPSGAPPHLYISFSDLKVDKIKFLY